VVEEDETDEAAVADEDTVALESAGEMVEEQEDKGVAKVVALPQ
jgi:hypothetical protein